MLKSLVPVSVVCIGIVLLIAINQKDVPKMVYDAITVGQTEQELINSLKENEIEYDVWDMGKIEYSFESKDKKSEYSVLVDRGKKSLVNSKEVRTGRHKGIGNSTR